MTNRAFIVINDANFVNQLSQSSTFKERFRQIAMQEEVKINEIKPVQLQEEANLETKHH